MSLRKKFQLDRRNGMLMGVCAGMADFTGWNVTWIRAGLVLGTIIGGFPWTLVAYGLAAWLAKPKSEALYSRDEFGAIRGSGGAFRTPADSVDRRIADVENYVASSNSRLADEIERLR